MECSIDQKLIEKTIKFHGHSCPGLAIGIRASELAIQKLKIDRSQTSVCVVETDMCAVDGIQFLTGCTFGKGNLIHKDYGKSGFTFFDRKTKKGFRAVFNERPSSIKSRDNKTRERRTDEIMQADLEDIFQIKEISDPPVRPAKILKSLECQVCREKVMESRIRRFDGKYLCIPCFMEHEQKI